MPSTALKGAHLSFQQERLWLLQQAGMMQHVWSTIAIRGKLNCQVFERALQQIVEQHTIFQTLFYPLPGMDIPVQVIGHQIELSCPIISLEQMALPQQNTVIETILGKFQQQPFDLRHGPLLRPAMFRLATEHTLFLLSLPAFYADATTLSLLMQELLDRYTALLVGQEDEDEETLQYTAISAWQRQQAAEESEEAAEAKRFWQQIHWPQMIQIQHNLERNGLFANTGKQTLDTQTLEPATSPVPVDHDLLYKLATHYATSVLAVLLACWLVVLQRLTNESQLVIGLARDGRNYEDLLEALGPHTRFVPLEITLQNTWSFEQLLAFVQPLLEATEEYQHYFTWPSVLNEGQGYSSELPHFFPIVFEHEQWPSSLEAQGVQFRLHRRQCWSEPFFLKLSVQLVGEEIDIALDYDTHSVSDTWIQQLAAMLQTLLNELVEQPQTQIDMLSLLSQQQSRDLQTAFRGKERSWPEQSLHQLFEAQVRLRPGALAVISQQEKMTYQELNQRANQLARVLQHRGIGPNVLVGICLARQASMLVGLLGILKVGGAYLPLDASHPAQRLQYQLQESGASLLLTQEHLRGALPDWDGTILCLEEIDKELAQASPNDLQIQSQPEQLAYVIYTSGSTGVPKGVMITQQNVINYTHALCEQWSVEPGWHYATVSTLAADLGNTAIFCALASGGCVQILDYETVISGEAMVAWAERHPIDVLKIVPSHLSALLESSAQANVFLPRCLLVLGGEALSGQLIARIGQAGATCQVYNHYGPTETTIGVLVNAAGKACEEYTSYTQIALGRPIANTQVYALDPHLQIVPQGVIGELYIGGAGLARGYLEQAGLTAERFVPHPYSQSGGERLYRTGDLARYGQGEQIEFVGRQDGQVKLRGYRIEVGEIEAALKQHPQIRDGVVMLQEDMPGGPQLISYIVPKKWPLSTGITMRDFLQERLPDYMIPKAFIPLKFLPLTANGKIDRRQLAAKSGTGGKTLQTLIDTSHAPRTIVPPRDVIEMQLLQIWEYILQFQPVSVMDDFFDIGGHSLLAVQLIAQIAERCGYNLDLATLFRHSTIAKLASVLRQQNTSEAEPLLAAIQTQGTRPPFFCVHPAGGTAFCYIPLSRRLGLDQPFYGLHAPLGASAGGQGKVVGESIEEIAAQYIAAIQTVQPQGPYLLGGWSLGGVIALEMAQQLQRQGHKVELLAIFDSFIPTPQEGEEARARSMDLSDASIVREFVKATKILVPDNFEGLTVDERLTYAIEQAKKMHIIPEDATVDLVKIYTRVRIMTKHIVHVYSGNEYSRSIDYFLSNDATKQVNTIDDEEGGAGDEEESKQPIEPKRLQRWRELGRGGFDIHHVLGSHSEMLEEPHVQVLAQALQKRIQEFCDHSA